MTDIRRSRRILIAWLIAYAALGLLGGLTGIGQRDEQAFSFIAGVPTMVFIYLWRTRPTAGAAFKAIGGALAFYLLASVVLGGFESLGMAWRKE